MVIAILALLMALLFPVLGRARKSAQSVICQGRLRQTGLAFSLYLEHNNGQLPRQEDGFWHIITEGRWEKDRGLLLCPSAAKPLSDDRSLYSDTFHAYYSRSGNCYSSYGSNHMMYLRYGRELVREATIGWFTAYVREAPNVPVFFDCLSYNVPVGSNDQPPPQQEGYDKNFPMSFICINRHNGAINMLFMDCSVRKVGLKGLWTLRWYREFDTAGPWTQAGGVKPEDWPEWMRGFKDY